MIVEANEVYRSNNRLRIRIPSKKRDAAYFGSLVKHFANLRGIEEVRVNPITAGVLFIHDVDVETIAGHAGEHGLFTLRLDNNDMRRDSIFGAASKSMAAWNRQLRRFSGGSLDVPSLIFLGLVITGFYQITRGNLRMPPWYTAFWYALGIFSKAAFDTLEEGGDFGDDGSDGD
jgi:hypothetical protein